MLHFSDPITKIPGVSSSQAKKLQKLKIEKIQDLLYHFPFRYEDFSVFKEIKDILPQETVTIRGAVEEIKRVRVFRRKMSITEAYVNDGTGTIKSTWFNVFGPLRYLSKGKYIQISGKTTLDKKNELHFQHPNFEIISKKQFESKSKSLESRTSSTGTLVPIYPETRGLTSYWLRAIIKKTLQKTSFEEFVPSDILKDQKLPSLKEALFAIHLPEDRQNTEKAKQRFAFEKLFLLQIKAISVKKSWEDKKATKILFKKELVDSFLDELSFSLTTAQKKAAWQIIQDLEKEKPMNRLLEGDVGSGKTVVAAMAMLLAANQEKQVAFLAPTEILATQHFESLKKMFFNQNFEIALLTSALSKNKSGDIPKATLKKQISKGEVQVIIGTHALLQKSVYFKDLALVLIDEQHRFGVKQRAHLQQQTLSYKQESKKIPHLLTMTATPIPRTLSLAIFGNLDLSIIDEYPKGRKEIATKVIPPEGRNQIYSFVKKELNQGRQVFIIYPLVTETSKMSDVKAATEEHLKLEEKIFPEFKIGLLHGKMKPKEKESIMKSFKDKKLDLLVATSVVEVGVDVPNATIMIIEGAERFGLSQLHQFRGRVGRGSEQSYCFLFTSDNVPQTTRRLSALEKTNDGFELAREDLKLRGPGQFVGTMQSGIPDVTMESLSDVKKIQATRIQAQRILSFDPTLEKFPSLKKQLDELEKITHLE